MRWVRISRAPEKLALIIGPATYRTFDRSPDESGS
jgi:hypothetical protein